MKRSLIVEIVHYLAMGLLFLAVAQMVMDATAKGQSLNQWTKPAPHHKAACIVSAGNRTGSGVYVQAGSVRGVLTCAHLFAGNPQTSCVTFSDGAQQCGKYTTDKYQHDVAFVFVTHRTINPLHISRTNPRTGSSVEFVTYGGPRKSTLRHFSATVQAVGNATTNYTASVVVGDSGGAILNTSRQVVGIQSYGHQLIGQSGGARVFRGSGGPSLPHIRAFVTRVVQRVRRESGNTQAGYQPCIPCRQGGIFNRQQVVVQQPAIPQINEADLYPPAGQPQILDSTPQVAVQPSKLCDCDPAQLASLRAELAALRQQLAQQRYDGEPQAPTEPVPQVQTPAVSPEEVQAVRDELAALKARVSTLSNRPVDVELLDENKRVIDRKSYPAGTPIRLQGVYAPAPKSQPKGN